MAKSGGRREAAARLFVLLSILVAASAGPLVGQQVELRAGAVLSSTLAVDAIAAGAATVRETARPAPLAGATVVVPLRRALALEVGGAYAFSTLRPEDASGSWGGQRLGIAQALVGVRYLVQARRSAAAGGPYVRGAVGVVHYSVAGRSIFDAGNPLEPAVEVGAGWDHRLGVWGVGAELAAQIHAFEPEALRLAGATSGSVRRGFVVLTLSRSVGR